ncbi:MULTISPECIES: SHOCT domain-containing protein [Cryobacterium]|uniref:SHOCT domain-containing protein n=1 Tax=Cryobacterium breve TaxID=1259258 RepID=A0ABY2IZT4_9MICO|nr:MULTISPECIES: SHOCT domain-containing protein [Cryobacterium]TFC96768.1 SHOCT domain-containing protein [Cryobacterium sp. TmT3-12]TFC97435.1 SHOCT domain-containing protein [Cryobacterium breve]
MMWGYGGNMGLYWLFGLLAIVGISLLVVLLVRLFSGDRSAGQKLGGEVEPSRARQILDERFARGELTAEQYREQRAVLGDDKY